jgi:hypothetical protein
MRKLLQSQIRLARVGQFGFAGHRMLPLLPHSALRIIFVSVFGSLSGMAGLWAADILELSNGKRAAVEILRQEEAGLKIKFQGAERTVPWAEIAAIEFAPDPADRLAVEGVKAGGPIVPLMEVWVRKKSWLKRPKSNAGEIGLAYGAALESRNRDEETQRALELYQELESADWDTARRELARQARLRLMLRQGKVAEVEAEVKQIATEQEDPRLLIESRYLLGMLAWAKLKDLQKEHPKWMEEEDVKPLRMELYNKVADQLIYPLLFHGDQEELSIRGLRELIRFYQECGEPQKAAQHEQDLERLYPIQKAEARP